MIPYPTSKSNEFRDPRQDSLRPRHRNAFNGQALPRTHIASDLNDLRYEFRTDGARNQSWGLSVVGDWNTFTDAGVAETRTHGPAHELLTLGAATVTHDSRGNMTQDGQGKAMTWDVNGMLASVTVPAGASTGVAGTHTYKYDVFGRRVRKITTGANASDTVYVHEDQRVMCEYTYGEVYSNPLRTYVYASYVDEPVMLIDRTAAGAVGAGTDERFFYHRNQQYSVTALSDAAGAVVERYAYTAYGEPKILDGAGTTTRTASAVGNPYLYTARAYDAESGLYYFRARMYEGRKGRFLSHDPIRYPDGANTYAGWFAACRMGPSGMLPDIWLPALDKANMDQEILESPDCAVGVSVGFVNDYKTEIASTFNGFTHVIGISIATSSPNWDEAISDIQSHLPSHCCISHVTFSAHGSYDGGFAGGNMTIKNMRDSNHGAHRLMEFLRSRKCKKGADIDIRACCVAKTSLGKTFIGEMADYSGYDVVAYDDYYAITPYGGAWLASPGMKPVCIRTYPPYKGSGVEKCNNGRCGKLK